MKILDAKVEWMKDFANHPHLCILVDKMPDRESLTYNKVDTIYYAIHEGYGDFFHYDGPSDGYGGREFKLNMSDGTVKILKGPWSSREGCVNSIVSSKYPDFANQYLVEVSMTADEEVFYKRNYTYCKGSITLPLALIAAKMAKCYLVKEQYNGDITFYPSLSPDFVVKPFNSKKSKPTYSRYLLGSQFSYKTLTAAKDKTPTKIFAACYIDKSGNIEQVHRNGFSYSNSRGKDSKLVFMADNGKTFTPEQAAVLAYAFNQIPEPKAALEIKDLGK